MADLREYRRKRDPKATPEPFEGRDARTDRRPVFVVQRHSARRLHYDLRLERNGALASWAVPRGLPMEPGGRSLAVHVEDHPLDYAAFEGEIPAGQYGAGTVEIWDRGTYETLSEKRDGSLTVRLSGRRLNGTWALAPAHLGGDPKNWLVIRKREDDGRSWRRQRYAPMLPTRAARAPSGSAWRFEVRWEGMRALCRIAEGEPTFWGEDDRDLTERLRGMARRMDRAIRTPECVLDGEACALDEAGVPRADLLERGEGTPAYYVWDVLEVEGEPLVDRAWRERRERLLALVVPDDPVVRVSEAFPDGAALLRAAREQGLAGVVAKRVDAPYAVGRRSDDWRSIPARRAAPPARGRAAAPRVRLTNSDKVFFPEEGIRKGDLVDYYRAIAPALVPHLRDRPFTMIRYPDGIAGEHFFQKNRPQGMPDWIPTVDLPAGSDPDSRIIRFPLVNDADALVWMANAGCIDMNAWYSRADQPRRPDYVLFDLDPSEGSGFAEAARVAHLVREALDLVGLRGYPKTSSGRGVHVMVPIARDLDYADVRRFCAVVADALARTHPGLVTTQWTKARRRGVLIDANQIGYAKTISSVYSVRPRPGAPVSTPLEWDELTEDLDPRSFTMDVVRRRLGRRGDLFAPVLTGGQDLRAALERLT